MKGRGEGRVEEGRAGREEDMQAFSQFQIWHYTTANATVNVPRSWMLVACTAVPVKGFS